MFIAHGEWVRRNARWILAGVLVLLIPGFIALFTTTGGAGRGTTELPTIRGKPVNPAEYQRAREAVIESYVVRNLRQLPRTAEVEDEVNQEAVLRLLLLRKAKELGIRVTDDELVRYIRMQTAFRTEAGQFDPERYRRFLIALNNQGISESRFEQLMREDLVIGHLQMLVGTTAKVTPAAIEMTYRPLHEKLWVDVVEFDVEDYKKPVTVTDEEARQDFEKNIQSYRILQQAKVKYVKFALDDAADAVNVSDQDITEYYERNNERYAGTNAVAPPLEDVRDEIEDELIGLRADRLAADRATEFAIKLVPEPDSTNRADFAKLCTERVLQPHETDYFSPTNKVAGVDAGLQFNQVAFALTPAMPFSDPVAGDDGYYVLEYVDSKPSRLPTFDEVKQQVIDELKTKRMYEALDKLGQEKVAEVKKLMDSGKSFADACAQLDLKVQSKGPFTLSDREPTLPAENRIQQAVLGISTNSVSEFFSTPTGGLFFYMKDRLPPSPEEIEKGKAEMAQQLLQRDQQAMFSAWLSAIVQDEQVNFGRVRRRPTPQPESEAEEALPAEPTNAPAAPS